MRHRLEKRLAVLEQLKREDERSALIEQVTADRLEFIQQRSPGRTPAERDLLKRQIRDIVANEIKQGNHRPECEAEENKGEEAVRAFSESQRAKMGSFPIS